MNSVDEPIPGLWAGDYFYAMKTSVQISSGIALVFLFLLTLSYDLDGHSRKNIERKHITNPSFNKANAQITANTSLLIKINYL